MSNDETELKFKLVPKDIRKVIAARPLRGKQLRNETLISAYFDTPSHKLAKNGISLRLRRNGDKRLQTVKCAGTVTAFKRAEWEHQLKSDNPDLRKVRDTPLKPMLSKKLKRSLAPIFETRVHRTTVPLRKNGSSVDVALDHGRIYAGRRSLPICELELELKRGKVRDVFDLAREIGKIAPIKLELKSKFDRGFELIENAPEEAVRAEKIALVRGEDTAEAFRVIGRSNLRQIAANEAMVRQSDPEAVHQMRVGLRRLRAAISLFSKLFGDKQTEQLKTELKWLTNELAPAREIDVYERNKIAPLRGTVAAKRGMQELSDTLSVQRRSNSDRAATAVASSRYRSLLLKTLQWLEDGDWARRWRSRGPRRIERFAAKILARRAKKAMKTAKKLRKLSARKRHKLRIAVKKLRYATDFFEHFFRGRKAKGRLSAFKAQLKKLQDHLGSLNDIRAHQQIAQELAAGKSPTKNRERAFAAGIVTGHEQSEIEPLQFATNKDARKFADVKPYWT